jgi:hypothetical protein
MNPAVEVRSWKSRTKLKEGFMKSKIISLVVLGALSLCPSLFAQTSRHPTLAVTVPFEFVVGKQIFPAGTYEFHSLLASVADKGTVDVLVVRSTDGELYRAIVTDVVGNAGPSRPRVVFTRSGDRAFLSEVWESGKASGCRLKSGQDRLQTAATESDKVTLIAAADRL